MHNYRVEIPLFSVEESKDVLAGHETLLHVTQLQVVHLQHVFLLLFLQGATEKHIFERYERDDLMPDLRNGTL